MIYKIEIFDADKFSDDSFLRIVSLGTESKFMGGIISGEKEEVIKNLSDIPTDKLTTAKLKASFYCSKDSLINLIDLL